MSNYTKTTDFEAKDSLPTGDAEKIIRGADFETEFDNIATAIATSRALVAILENYQNKDGTVDIPKVLQPYMNGVKKLKKNG